MDTPTRVRGAEVEHAAAALARFTATFTEKRGPNGKWRLAVDAFAPVTDEEWAAEKDAVLYNALQALQTMGGLPMGAAARSREAWVSASDALKAVKATLAESGSLPERGRNHKCQPGYDDRSCKQARAQPSLQAV